MDRTAVLLFSLLCIVVAATPKPKDAQNDNMRKTYIIHMEKSHIPTSFGDRHMEWYESTLKAASSESPIMYVYEHVIDGFSVRITSQEAEALKAQSGVIYLREETRLKLHTTHTPTFLGLDHARKSKSFPSRKAESDVIIGVLDSGVWPELESFNDTGLGPVRSTWNGACEEGTNFNSTHCNKKLVGARFFCKGAEAEEGPINVTMEFRSPRDIHGHGTHTASTAAGSPVDKASLFGYAYGTAMGMAAHARLAVYKIGWKEGDFSGIGIYSSDFFAAMDKAISDGVDIISLSFGLGDGKGYDSDPVAIASFTAMSKGILVSCAVGNNGPRHASVENQSPWAIDVGVGTIDRDFPAYVSLGNGKTLFGISLHDGNYSSSSSPQPLVYVGNASVQGDLIPSLVSGKIVIYDQDYGIAKLGEDVKRAGGVGVIVGNLEELGEELEADADLAKIPSVTVGQKAGKTIKEYAIRSKHPVANIRWGFTRVGVQPSPKVTRFSSRGPSKKCAQILKPDIIAPGFNVLAGWTGKLGPTELAEDHRRVSFIFMSGTSMACPHVSGVAGLLKAAHPDWSPSAIKSALMTTAYVTYKDGRPLQTDDFPGAIGTPYDYGAGHLNPVPAFEPGLVYDATAEDYLAFLCAANYTSQRIKLITNRDYECEAGNNYSLGDLNYPSFSVALPSDDTARGGYNETKLTVLKYSRTLTNVDADVPVTYKLVSLTVQTSAVKIKVEPQVLRFTKLNEKKTYTVTFKAFGLPSQTTSYGRLVWSDGKHDVASPIAFVWGEVGNFLI